MEETNILTSETLDTRIEKAYTAYANALTAEEPCQDTIASTKKTLDALLTLKKTVFTPKPEKTRKDIWQEELDILEIELKMKALREPPPPEKKPGFFSKMSDAIAQAPVLSAVVTVGGSIAAAAIAYASVKAITDYEDEAGENRLIRTKALPIVTNNLK